MVRTPSTSREPRRRRNRLRCTSVSAEEPATSKDSCTRESVVFTPWPPGPDERE